MTFQEWGKLKPVYFPTWVWQELSRKFPNKYKMHLPVRDGQKVILT